MTKGPHTLEDSIAEAKAVSDETEEPIEGGTPEELLAVKAIISIQWTDKGGSIPEYRIVNCNSYQLWAAAALLQSIGDSTFARSQQSAAENDAAMRQLMLQPGFRMPRG